MLSTRLAGLTVWMGSGDGATEAISSSPERVGVNTKGFGNISPAWSQCPMYQPLLLRLADTWFLCWKRLLTLLLYLLTEFSVAMSEGEEGSSRLLDEWCIMVIDALQLLVMSLKASRLSASSHDARFSSAMCIALDM